MIAEFWGNLSFINFLNYGVRREQLPGKLLLDSRPGPVLSSDMGRSGRGVWETGCAESFKATNHCLRSFVQYLTGTPIVDLFRLRSWTFTA